MTAQKERSRRNGPQRKTSMSVDGHPTARSGGKWRAPVSQRARGNLSRGASFGSLHDIQGRSLCQRSQRHIFKPSPTGCLHDARPISRWNRAAPAHGLGGLVMRANIARKGSDRRPEINDVRVGHAVMGKIYTYFCQWLMGVINTSLQGYKLHL